MQGDWEFGRKMIKMAYDEFKYINKHYNSLIDEFGDVDGVRELADEIKGLYDSELYEKFFNVFVFHDKHNDLKEIKFTEEDSKKVVMAQLAYGNMGHPIVYSPPLTDLLIFYDFYRVYTFFADIYEINTGKKVDYNEMRKIHLCKLDEHLIFALDKFDEVTETPEPTAEYFQKLGKVKWKDKKTKKLLGKTIRLYGSIHTEKWGIREGGNLTVSEEKFLLLLAGCSAVNNNRDKINMEDIIIAYRTYFKLLKTDLPVLVDNLWEMNKSEVDK
ncbi:MAG: hypothetical protein HZC47_02935 [Methanobacterium sp.]|uniref:hypothetical protein n=1 Tax=Methanobacterium sp. TaxID=2164 RepID=UPI003D646567|nr:hypothetical protein [Methanobacterium sp.]